MKRHHKRHTKHRPATYGSVIDRERASFARAFHKSEAQLARETHKGARGLAKEFHAGVRKSRFRLSHDW